jgi:hypothetical protein
VYGVTTIEISPSNLATYIVRVEPSGFFTVIHQNVNYFDYVYVSFLYLALSLNISNKLIYCQLRFQVFGGTTAFDQENNIFYYADNANSDFVYGVDVVKKELVSSYSTNANEIYGYVVLLLFIIYLCLMLRV